MPSLAVAMMLHKVGQAQRHDLVWLNEAGWHAVSAKLTLSPQQVSLLQRWQQQDWPLVGRRRDVDAGAEEVCLGLASPPDAQGVKGRLSLRVPLSGVRLLRAPLEIKEVLAQVKQARPTWYEALAQLQQKAEAQGLCLRLYGSLALQVLTGQPYLRESSDIDLLFAPADSQELTEGMQLLTHYAALLPLDGEVRFADGSAVAWKEWRQASAATRKSDQRVLAKRDGDVALVRIDSLLQTLEAPALCQY